MAGDWIKMRVWLSRDPRVIKMADYLAEQRCFMNWLTDPVQQSCKNTAYEHVTRNVTVALCVTGLLVTWGTAREQGDRFGDDLILDHCDKYTFDAITDIECFGEAMEHVGWIEETENGSVIFPKFFKDNESPDEKHKRQNAERQAKHRQKTIENNNVTRNAEVTQISNVTVTPREEKRRVNNISTIPSLFVEFWNAYGKKVGKPNALKEWKKISPSDDEANEIISAANSLRLSRPDPTYRKDPERWLKARGWEDEIQESKSSTSDTLTELFARAI